MNIHAQRLLNVARALREAPEPNAFDMGDYVHPCGTPACALGHYAARQDLQAIRNDDLIYRRHTPIQFFLHIANYCDQKICDHFGITEKEAELLFSGIGCGGAETAEQAAKYIEDFVAVCAEPQIVALDQEPRK